MISLGHFHHKHPVLLLCFAGIHTYSKLSTHYAPSNILAIPSTCALLPPHSYQSGADGRYYICRTTTADASNGGGTTSFVKTFSVHVWEPQQPEREHEY